MKAFIVYCHPSKDSFTKNMCDAFIKGITDSGNEFILNKQEDSFLLGGRWIAPIPLKNSWKYTGNMI